MALNSPPVFTTGPTRGQLPFGLFSVLAPTTGPERWEAGGVTWQAMTCEPAQPLPFECSPDESSEQLRFEDSGPNYGEAKPFIVNGFFECGSVGFSLDDARALAEAHLISTEQTAVEKAFWNGDQQNYPNLSNAGGDEDDTPYSAPTNLGTLGPVEALAQLEEFIASMYGSVGVIHMPRATALRLLSKKLLHTLQGRLYTRLDTPVVAGAGYSGDTIRATPAIFGYRSDVFTNTEQMGGFDPQRNDLRGHAARTYVIGFDPCGTATVTVTTDTGGGDIEFPESMNVNVTNLPDNQNVTVTEPVEVSNFPDSVTEVSVSNLPATQDVNVTNTPLPVETQTDEEEGEA